jgi:hypothetical protein
MAHRSGVATPSPTTSQENTTHGAEVPLAGGCVGVAVASGLAPGTKAGLLKYAAMATAARTTTRAAAANLIVPFVSRVRDPRHSGRRCGVTGSRARTSSRTLPGRTVAPSSSHDVTIRVSSKSELIWQPPAPPAAHQPRGPTAAHASRNEVVI